MAEQKRRDKILPQAWVWSWGVGTHGQLASGSFTDHWQPLPLASFGTEIDSSIDACSKIIDMAGGGAHVVAVMGSNGHGQVVTWGSGHAGALGHGDESDSSVPKLVKYFQGIQICSVAAGWNHTAFAANSGELYTCGSGSFGQLGHGDLEARLVPSKVEALSSLVVSMVACGLRHTLVLACGTHKGSAVYGFGSSKRGQLGLQTGSDFKKSQQRVKDSGKISVPQSVKALREHQIALLNANGDHSAALSENGVLFLWGRGFNGGSDAHAPASVGSQLRFSQVALGWNHCIVLTDDGQLWACGSNDRGQLGILNSPESEYFPLTLMGCMPEDSEEVFTAVSPLGNSQAIMGKTQGESTAAYADIHLKHSERKVCPPGVKSSEWEEGLLPSVIRINRDQVVTCAGSPEGGGKSQRQWLEMLRVCGLEGKRVKWLSAGAEHSAIVLDNGEIMAWGWGEHGQLGLGTVEDKLYPEVVPIPSSKLEGKLRWRTFCGSGFTFAIADHIEEA